MSSAILKRSVRLIGCGAWESRAALAGGLPPAATISASMHIAITNPMRITGLILGDGTAVR